MMSSNSANVELRMGNQGCCYTTCEIERTMPAAMNGHMNNFEWENFCSQVDTAMEPLSKAIKIIQVSWMLDLCVVLGVFIAIPILMTSDAISVYVFAGLDSGFVILITVPFVLFMCLGIGSACYGNVIRNQVIQSITKICEETSKVHTRISFHFRDITVTHGSGEHAFRQAYIEVSMNNQDNTTMDVPLSLTGSTTSTAARLEDLEAVKNLISDEEYNQKRADILKSV